MIESPLTFDKDPIVLVGEIEDHFFDHTCHKVADDAISGQAITGDHNASLTGSHKGAIETAPVGFAIEFECDGHFSCRAIRANHQHSMTAGTVGCIERYTGSVGWTANVPDSGAVLLGSLPQFRIVGEKNVQATDNVQASMDGSEQLPAPGLGERSAHGSYTDQETIGLVAKGFVNIAYNRYSLSQRG